MRKAPAKNLLTLLSVTLIFALLFGASAPALSEPDSLTLRTLRNAGGMERGMNVRLTTALERFLKEQGEKVFRVEPRDNAPKENRRGSARYTLEGDLSFASGQSDTEGRFLLILRLFREDALRTLVGQWSGKADSLRYLTANLRNDPRVHTFGLVGEMGSRISMALAKDHAAPGQQWRRLLPLLKTSRNPEVEIVSAESATLPHLKSGRSFRVRLRAKNCPRECWLITASAAGQAHLLPLTLASPQLTAASPESVLSKILRLPADVTDAWLVWREFPQTQTGSPAEVPHFARCTAAEDEPPVQVLNGVGADSQEGETVLRHQIEIISGEPGNWKMLPIPASP